MRSPRAWFVVCSGLSAALLVLAIGADSGLAAEKVWGTDINAGDGPALIESVRADLAKIVAAPEAERGALIDDFVATRGGATAEALKRFRNPELVPLFRRMLAHDDWRVRHRALLALEHLGDSDSIATAWTLLSHEVPRMRERAALFILATWDAGVAKEAAGGDPAAALGALRAAEPDAHVASCLDALVLRARGKLPVVVAHQEHVITLPDGLMLTPFISGMHEARQVAPDYQAKGVSLGGGSSAAKLDASRPWTTPLLAMGDEEVQGTSLQPFANLRQEGKVYHTGLDIGACMDGAGYYAAGDGIVRMVHSGSDMGTMLVVQHHLGGKRLANAVYMHGGSLVFVKGGEQVRAGQLLGTMGMSYSIENGGHYAHLHYGLYPGEFSQTHNYGYRGVPAGLVDWYDPAHYLPVWREISAPLVPPISGGSAELAKARARLDVGRVADAWAEADKALAGDVPDAVRSEAEALRSAIAASIAGAPERAARIRDLGYPGNALAFLETAAKSAKGLGGADEVASMAKEWKKDADLKAAIKAEGQVVAAEEKAMGLVGQKGGAGEAKALYEALLEELGPTCLAPRIEALVRGTGVR